MKVRVWFIAFVMSLVGIAGVGRAQSPVTTVRLSQDQIVTVKTAQGITTRLSFQQQVQEIICGDLYDPESRTGSFVVQRSGKDVFLKPLAPKGLSNLFVKTGENSERIYSFDLVIVPAAQANRIVNVLDAQATPVAAGRQPNNTPPTAPPVASRPVPSLIASPVATNSAPPIIASIGEANTGADNAPGGMQEIGWLATFSPPPPPSNGKSKPEQPREEKSNKQTQRAVIRRAPADYPEFARASGVRGQVVVEVTINENGKVVSAQAISGPIALRPSAVLAARLWRFSPAREGDRERHDIARITFNFQGGDKVESISSTPYREYGQRNKEHGRQDRP